MSACGNTLPLNKTRARVRCLGVGWKVDPESGPSSQLPFLNRPFLHHLADTLVDRGIEEIEFVGGTDVRSYAALLGNGERWGVTFRFVESASNPLIADSTKGVFGLIT